ncbi:hypothetical protein RRG08_036814 [Elysia crispata]|uniref:Uncharacterized protein n=1 Tax=Elysia crispata TaxID=231223 RepID=A0AAE1CU36_9GAST|nr:hypothetical protein RRG08_036814 [Elysia crispata]
MVPSRATKKDAYNFSRLPPSPAIILSRKATDVNNFSRLPPSPTMIPSRTTTDVSKFSRRPPSATICREQPEMSISSADAHHIQTFVKNNHRCL